MTDANRDADSDVTVRLHRVTPGPWHPDNPTPPVTSIPRPRPVDPRAAVSRNARAAQRSRAHEARQALALGIIVGFLVSDVLFLVVLVLALRHWGLW